MKNLIFAFVALSTLAPTVAQAANPTYQYASNEERNASIARQDPEVAGEILSTISQPGYPVMNPRNTTILARVRNMFSTEADKGQMPELYLDRGNQVVVEGHTFICSPLADGSGGEVTDDISVLPYGTSRFVLGKDVKKVPANVSLVSFVQRSWVGCGITYQPRSDFYFKTEKPQEMPLVRQCFGSFENPWGGRFCFKP